MKMNWTKLEQDLIAEEGLSLTAYTCPAGHKTIGVGHNLDAHPQDDCECCSLAQAGQWLFDDLMDATVAVSKILNRDVWDNLNDVRQRALVSMCFCLGASGFAGFRKMIRAIQRDDWQAAEIELFDSRFAKTHPARVQRLKELFAMGER